MFSTPIVEYEHLKIREDWGGYYYRRGGCGAWVFARPDFLVSLYGNDVHVLRIAASSLEEYIYKISSHTRLLLVWFVRN